jgi:5-oxoprolinase (ATP-hydrolysing)
MIYERTIEVSERVRPLHPFEKNVETLKTFTGSNGESFILEQALDTDEVRGQLKALKEEDPGITSLAIVLMHSYAFDAHEKQIEAIAREMGFSQVSLSSMIMQRVKLVKRGQTCCVDAYLNPHIFRYLEGFTSGFAEELLRTTQVFFMQSDGGLAPIDKFTGSKAILSGPAGGVVGYSITSTRSQLADAALPVIGFDMGGTSTDVSRFDKEYEHIFETEIAGTSIQAPQLNISTVAAGGGSRLFFEKGLYKVGPESSGADPGPVCYRKPGGLLAVTDANLLLGRLLPEHFPKIFGPNEDSPLDI